MNERKNRVMMTVFSFHEVPSMLEYSRDWGELYPLAMDAYARVMPCLRRNTY